MRILATFLFLSSLASAVSPQQHVQTLINQARAKGVRCAGGGGSVLPVLRYNSTLYTPAQNHAYNMGARSFVSHFYAGVGPRVRVVRAGYSYSRMSEIIFKGSRGNAEQALKWWLNSPVHCRAIMNPHYQEFAAGYYNGAWAVVLAKPH